MDNLGQCRAGNFLSFEGALGIEVEPNPEKPDSFNTPGSEFISLGFGKGERTCRIKPEPGPESPVVEGIADHGMKIPVAPESFNFRPTGFWIE